MFLHFAVDPKLLRCSVCLFETKTPRETVHMYMNGLSMKCSNGDPSLYVNKTTKEVVNIKPRL